MTKKGLKGWIITLAALGILGTTGVGLTGYYTKGFTQWKTEEKMKDDGKTSESTNQDHVDESSVLSSEEEQDTFTPANLAASRHVKRANGSSSIPMLDDIDDYSGWTHYGFQVDDQDDNNLPYQAFVGITKDFIVCVIDGDHLSDNTHADDVAYDNHLDYAWLKQDTIAIWGDAQTMTSRGTWYGGGHNFIASTYFDYDVYWTQYNEEDLNALKDGQTKDIFIDVDNNYSKETIINAVSAKDLFGAECTVTVTSGLDTFTPSTIGVYTLKLKATDSYGQTAQATLIVHICDYVAPSITLKKQLTFTADQNQTLKYSDLATYIGVTDNGTSHGSSLTITYKYDGVVLQSDWTKTFKAADYGTHNVAVNAKDGSGNEKNVTFSLKVNDGTAPVLSRTDGAAVGSKITIGVSKTFTMTLSDVTQLFKAVDNVDGDVSSSITGLADADNNFFANNHKVGSYTLTIAAKDKNNNQVTQVIPIEIVADIPPVFIIADTLVYTDTSNPLDISQLNMVVSNGILADQHITSLSVDASEYIGHENEPGTYHIDYQYTTTGTKQARRFNANGNGNTFTGAFDLIVREAKEEDPAPEPEEPEENGFIAFFKAIGEWFMRLFNWFRGIFTHFDFTCWLTNEEFDERYPVEKAEVQDTSVDAPADTTVITE